MAALIAVLVAFLSGGGLQKLYAAYNARQANKQIDDRRLRTDLYDEVQRLRSEVHAMSAKLEIVLNERTMLKEQNGSLRVANESLLQKLADAESDVREADTDRDAWKTRAEAAESAHENCAI